jgi:hypothetical protein
VERLAGNLGYCCCGARVRLWHFSDLRGQADDVRSAG